MSMRHTSDLLELLASASKGFIYAQGSYLEKAFPDHLFEDEKLFVVMQLPDYRVYIYPAVVNAPPPDALVLKIEPEAASHE